MRLRRGLLPSRWSIKFSSFSAPSPSGRYYIVDRTLERGLKRLAGCHPDCCRSPRKAIWQLDHRSERAAKIADKRKQLALRARQAARLLGRNDGDGAYGTKHGHAQIAQPHARERRLGLSANPEHAGATKRPTKSRETVIVNERSAVVTHPCPRLENLCPRLSRKNKLTLAQ
jgi:hypothetical protein